MEPEAREVERLIFSYRARKGPGQDLHAGPLPPSSRTSNAILPVCQFLTRTARLQLEERQALLAAHRFMSCEAEFLSIAIFLGMCCC